MKKQKTMKTVSKKRSLAGLAVALACAVLVTFALSRPSSADSQNNGAKTRDAVTRYHPVLLKFKGAEYITTTLCDAKSGALAFDFNGPRTPCVAVHFGTAADVSGVEAVYPNPVIIDEVLIHFTARDPLPARGGITIHN